MPRTLSPAALRRKAARITRDIWREAERDFRAKARQFARADKHIIAAGMLQAAERSRQRWQAAEVEL